MKKHESRGPGVLSVGRIYCDIVFTGAGTMPVLGREVFAEDVTIAAGGGAYIAGAYFASCSRPVALVARLGTDRLSAGLEGELEASGVDLRYLDRTADAGPQMTVVIVNGSERAFLSRRAGGARPSTLDDALSWREAGHLHIAEYATLAEIPSLVADAKSRGLTVSLDPSWDESLIRRPDLIEKCAGVDIFLPNLEEAFAITGKATSEDALAMLSPAFPLVALKAGGGGAFVSSGDGVLHRPARDVPVVDTTGAGDAFNAGFVDAWLDGASPAECLEAGIAKGSIAVQRAGGAQSLNQDPSRKRHAVGG